jgi:tyrosine-protein phosphatase YwqE
MALAGEWRDLGAYLQINYGSLLGRYGDAPRTRAFSLLERGWGDLFSTDFHGRPQLALNLLEVQEMFFGFEAGEQFDLLARVNPARIVSDQAPVTIPPLPRKKGWRDRLRDLLSGSWK